MMTDPPPDDLPCDPFCGGCGAACGHPCDTGCGAAMTGEGEGAVLLLAVHVPGVAVDVDAETIAYEFVTMLNEERDANGGRAGPVAVSTWPRPQWLRRAGVLDA